MYLHGLGIYVIIHILKLYSVYSVFSIIVILIHIFEKKDPFILLSTLNEICCTTPRLFVLFCFCFVFFLYFTFCFVGEEDQKWPWIQLFKVSYHQGSKQLILESLVSILIMQTDMLINNSAGKEDLRPIIDSGKIEEQKTTGNVSKRNFSLESVV